MVNVNDLIKDIEQQIRLNMACGSTYRPKDRPSYRASLIVTIRTDSAKALLRYVKKLRMEMKL